MRICILFCWLSSLFVTKNVLYATPVGIIEDIIVNNPQTIYQSSDIESCAEWKVIQYEAEEDQFEKKLSNREEGAFYSYDEQSEMIIIQKQLKNENISIKYIFLHKKKVYEILMVSCQKYLSENKITLKELVNKVKS